MSTPEQLRRQIRELTGQLHALEHAPRPFIPGETAVPYAGRCYGAEELQALVDESLNFWLTMGSQGAAFETELAALIGVRHCALVNSGSSAMLLAFAALTSPLLENPIRPGSEVITVAAGFPTTVNPILQHGCVPVFIDVELDTANADMALLEKALSEKTRAVVLAHTLGNPFAVDRALDFCRRHQLYLVEDNCDALGSRFRGRMTGSFGHIAASSFFPAHHITTGEGGAVYTDDPLLHRAVLSLRDWGRDCQCAPGEDNRCGRRFDQQHGALPHGYDHKYVYSHLGYNLRPTELQAAVGRVQLGRLDQFVQQRKAVHARLCEAVAQVPWLEMQQSHPDADPAWFAALLRLADDAPLSRAQVQQMLEEKKIQTRLLFGGNLTRQPAYAGAAFRVAGSLERTDILAEQAFFVGVWPGYTDAMIAYLAETLAALADKG